MNGESGIAMTADDIMIDDEKMTAIGVTIGAKIAETIGDAGEGMMTPKDRSDIERWRGH